MSIKPNKWISLFIETTKETLSLSMDAETESALRTTLAKRLTEVNSNTEIAETKKVTILLSDLRGFTAMAEQYSATEMVSLLNRYFSRMSEIIISHGGTIDKFMGDAIMALFGAPESYEDDLDRAILCAVEMQRAMHDINQVNKQFNMPPLFMGIGINTGKVVAGQLGSALHSEYTVIGDEVNLASRIEAHSLRGQVLISEASYQEAHQYIEIGQINEVQVKGKRNPVKLYELLSILGKKELSVPRVEVRKSPRVEVWMPLEFQCISGKIISKQILQGDIIDIAYNGIAATTPIPLPLLSEIKITLPLTVTGHQDSDIYAKVLHSTETDHRYKISLEFTSIDEVSQAAIKDYIDRIIGSR